MSIATGRVHEVAFVAAVAVIEVVIVVVIPLQSKSKNIYISLHTQQNQREPVKWKNWDGSAQSDDDMGDLGFIARSF